MVEELERPGENRDRKGTEANGGGGGLGRGRGRGRDGSAVWRDS